MKVLVCGSRGYSNFEAAWQRLLRFPVGTEFVVGDAKKGGDAIGRVFARATGAPLTVYAADWETHGKRAGFLRNIEMLDEEPQRVVALWDGQSRGTKHTIDEARKRGILVEVVPA